ncbi:hypothetical protein BLA29_000524 [Euroglyphus maynei]|uniref:beta-N-acetylhexosaminidase n=1 Tax=Euroglyphus maynei TaxID=6958 RepID=A0A1Y3BEJ3_EURMA|nr:hypothetical protein BLA29_000524 [Euroglyphus maynei]
MAYNKLNILHWHINDDQSFPFVSDASYSDRHVYSKHDIQHIIKEARMRAIQLIIEFNTPAHGHSLAKVFPGKYPFDKDIPIPVGTIVQVWKDRRLLDDDPRDWKFHVQRLLRFNHTVILSSCYFLNLIQYGQDWKQIYDCDPHDFDGFDQQQKQQFVIGGEACVWGEYIDQTNFMSRTWPRASAMAERLWSHMIDSHNYDDDVVHHRLDSHRCRMLG